MRAGAFFHDGPKAGTGIGLNDPPPQTLRFPAPADSIVGLFEDAFPGAPFDFSMKVDEYELVGVAAVYKYRGRF